MILVIAVIIGAVVISFYRQGSKAVSEINVTLNGNHVRLSTQCVTDGNYVLVPAEDISSALGAVIEKKTANSLQIVKGDTLILLTENSNKLQVDGKVEMMPVSARKSEGIIMVPIRYLADKLDANTGWDAGTKTILLTTEGKGVVVFLGDSLTANFNLQKYFKGAINKGNSGDTSFNVLGRLPGITMLKPEKLFIMIGTNDVWTNIHHDVTVANYRHIINVIRMTSPETEIIIQSILPLGAAALKNNPNASNEKITSLNKELQSLSEELNIKYVDIGSLYKDSSGRMNTTYSLDGIHIDNSFYKIWADAVSELVK